MRATKIGSAAVALMTLVALARPAAAAASATTDRSTVGADDRFDVTVSVSGGGQAELQTPALRDFRIVSRSRATEVTMTNGGAPTMTERFVLGVEPLRTGHLTFPSLTVRADGREQATAPLPIDVVPGHVAASAQAAPDPLARFGFGNGDPFADDDVADLMQRMQTQLAPRLGRNDVLVRASVDNPRPYVGQQATLSIHLLTRAPLSSVQLERLPSIAGATSADVPTPQRPEPEEVEVGGRRYQSLLLAKKAVFPLRAGALEVPPIAVAVEAGGWGGGQHLQPASAPVRIEARALPPGGVDDEAVGRWTLSAATAPGPAVAGEPLTVRVTATGTGDLHDLALPAPTLPAGWRSYAPSTHDSPRVDGGRLGGARTVETVVVPDRAGRVVLEVPPLRYFDPARGRHLEAASAPLVVTVQAAPAGVANAAATASAPAAASTSAASQAPRLTWSALRRWWLPTAAACAVVALLALAAMASQRLRARRRARAPSPSARLRQARRHLRHAARLRHGGQVPQFYDELAHGLRDTIAAAAPDEAAARGRLDQQLAAAGVAADTRRALLAAVDACDAGRFAPAAAPSAAMAHAWELAEAAVDAVGRGRTRHDAAPPIA